MDKTKYFNILVPKVLLLWSLICWLKNYVRTYSVQTFKYNFHRTIILSIVMGDVLNLSFIILSLKITEVLTQNKKCCFLTWIIKLKSKMIVHSLFPGQTDILTDTVNSRFLYWNTQGWYNWIINIKTVRKMIYYLF